MKKIFRIQILEKISRRSVMGAALAYFVFALAFQIHGFSWGRWAYLLEEPTLDTAWIGRARAARGDDFTVTLPTIFSQSTQAPRFPVFNRALGLGADLRLSPCPVPMRHWSVFFKPQLWGYFLSPDEGMSWHWNFYAVGLFLTSFFVLLRLGGEVATSGLLALAFVFSPFVQFWSYLPAHFYLFGWLMFLGIEKIHFAGSVAARFAGAAMLTWSAVAFALWIYPPFQIPVALGIAALGAASAGRCVSERGPRFYLTKRVPYLFLTGAIVGGVLWCFVDETRAILALLAQTAYPGQRFSYGGTGISSQLWLGNSIFAPFLNRVPALVPNLCEGAGFLLAFPVAFSRAAAGTLGSRAHRGSPVAFYLGAVAIFAAALVGWEIGGVPKGLADTFGLSRMVTGRNMIGYGLVEFIGVGIVASGRPPAGAARWGILLGWVALNGYALSRIYPVVPGSLRWATLGFSLLTLGVTTSLLFRPRWFAVGYVALAVASTWMFNPVVHGGYRKLTEGSPLLRAVRDVASADGFRSAWISLGSEPWGDLIRSVGVRTLDGIFFYPQRALWRILDPAGQFDARYNRYAEVSFLPAQEGVRLSNPTPNAMRIEVDIDDPRFLALPFRYLLGPSGDIPASRSAHYRRIREVPGNRSFSIWEKRERR